MEAYNGPAVGIGIIILNSSNEVLLLLRNSDALLADSLMRLEETWTLPAGKVKLNETLLEAGIRKAKQETNLDIVSGKLISVADDINQYAHFVTFGFLASSYSGKVTLSTDEHVAYKFFALDDLPKNLCVPSKKIIQNYLEGIIYREEDDYGRKKILH